jgi:hypothetical protein
VSVSVFISKKQPLYVGLLEFLRKRYYEHKETKEYETYEDEEHKKRSSFELPYLV